MSVTPLQRTASSPHRGAVEVATLAALYLVYEIVRGQGHASVEAARAHTDWVVGLERHFAGTTAFLVWLYRHHRHQFARVRNTMIAATGMALTLYVVFPVAPPRLASLGFVD